MKAGAVKKYQFEFKQSEDQDPNDYETYGDYKRAIRKVGNPNPLVDVIMPDQRKAGNVRVELRVPLPDHQENQEEDAGAGAGSPSEHLDMLTRAYNFKHPTLTYKQCLDKIMGQRPDLVRLHASESNGCLRVY